MYILIGLFKAALSIIYSIFKLFPSQDKVVFLSRQDDKPSLDFLLLRDKISEEHPEYTCILLCKKMGSSLINKFSYGLHILKQMYHLATSKVALLDSYIIPVSLLHHKKNLLIIQIWHSVGTMKKFGYSILDKPEGSSSKMANAMKMHEKYDFILAAGQGYVPHLMEGFNYPKEAFKIYPLPRVERLLDEEYKSDTKEKIYKEYPQLNGKKNIVYCPTFRKSANKELTTAVRNLIAEINFDDYNLIIKPHPLSELEIEDPRIILDNKFTSLEMIVAGDILISDYSCIIYEAAILGKPIYFYSFDYYDYMGCREIYLDYNREMPGPICSQASDLVRSIENHTYNYGSLERFLNKYVEIKGNRQAEDIVDFIFNEMKS